MSALLDSLALDHKRLRRLMFVLRAELDRFDRDELPDYERLLTLLEYIADYSDQWHHPAEDRAISYLDLEALDADTRAAIDQVRAQHRELPEATASLRRDLDAVMAGTVVPRRKLEDDANAYLTLQSEHLRIEDEVLFPALRKYLTAEQKAELDAAITTPDDPLFDTRNAERFERLYFDILEAEHSEHEDEDQDQDQDQD